jgi:hypothetical protein
MSMNLHPKAVALNVGHGYDFSDLSAIYINCTLKRSPEPSYTQTLMDRSIAVMQANDFTNRNTTFMTWNLMHTARILKDRGGFPAHGNQRSEWDAGCRFDYPNPEHR